MYIWADAAGQSRRDGNSTQGNFVGIAQNGCMKGMLKR